jgi:hypothetical protein
MMRKFVLLAKSDCAYRANHHRKLSDFSQQALL